MIDKNEWLRYCDGNQKIVDMIEDIKIYTPHSDESIFDAINRVRKLGVKLSLEEIVSFIWANETPFMRVYHKIVYKCFDCPYHEPIWINEHECMMLGKIMLYEDILKKIPDWCILEKM